MKRSLSQNVESWVICLLSQALYKERSATIPVVVTVNDILKGPESLHVTDGILSNLIPAVLDRFRGAKGVRSDLPSADHFSLAECRNVRSVVRTFDVGLRPETVAH